MEIKTIYKKNSKGTVFFWRGFVHKKNGEIFIMTEHGINGGKAKKSHRKITKKGRELSLEIKAQKIIQKKINDKKKKEGYVDNLEEINNPKKIFITPMLAKKVTFLKNNSIKGMKFPLYVQPKIDGFRCLCHFNKENKKIMLFSRKNKEYKGLDTIKKQLKKLYNNNNNNKFFDKSIYLDGELYDKNIPFEELSGHLKKAQHSIHYDLPSIKFLIFDCFSIQNPSPFSERTLYLRERINSKENIEYVETSLVNGLKEFQNKFDKFVTENYEGLMARNKDSFYEISKRSSNLQKYKKSMDDEFEIIGFEEGKGTDEGTVIWKCKTEENIIFNVRPVGTREHRSNLLKNAEKHIGDFLTVQYQELSNKKVPRFPVGKNIRENL